jgi:pimeloyl-ACP methyl ester carboxylesterase
MSVSTPQIRTIELLYNDKVYDIEYFIREGLKDTILFAHGLGGSKENYWEACKTKALADYTIISFDHPGTGNSTYYNDCTLDIDDLTAILTLFIDQLKLSQFVLAGTSMGGLTTLLYLLQGGESNVKAYINIEGNFMPEDCMFTSKVIPYDYDTFSSVIIHEMITAMKEKGNPGYHIIANNIQLNTNIKSYHNYSFQTVEYSSTGQLLHDYTALKIPKLFIYGDENHHLSYLPHFKKHNMKSKAISKSNHFMYYDNPKEMYEVIADFLHIL